MEAADAGAKRLQKTTQNTEPMLVGRLAQPHTKRGQDDRDKASKLKQCYRCGSTRRPSLVHHGYGGNGAVYVLSSVKSYFQSLRLVAVSVYVQGQINKLAIV